MLRCIRRSKAMPINWNGSSTSVRTMKANTIKVARIMLWFVGFLSAGRGAAEQ
jgi:hypothetical protein